MHRTPDLSFEMYKCTTSLMNWSKHKSRSHAWKSQTQTTNSKSSQMPQKMQKQLTLSLCKMITHLPLNPGNSMYIKSITQFITRRCVQSCTHWINGDHFSLTNISKFTSIIIPWYIWKPNQISIKNNCDEWSAQHITIARFSANLIRKMWLLMHYPTFKSTQFRYSLTKQLLHRLLMTIILSHL